MREFMDYVHTAFYDATGWDKDNSYAALNAPSDALLNFQTPGGLRLSLSALASPNFASSYQLGSVGVVDGSVSYLFSSVPLRRLITPATETVSLPDILRSYRPLGQPPRAATPAPPPAAGARPSLYYGRLYLPQSLLEALAVKRVSPALQLQFSAVSSRHLRNGGTTVALAQYDRRKWAGEALASSDGGLLGLRGLYHFGSEDKGAALPTPAAAAAATTTTTPAGSSDDPRERERIYGRFSAGGEIYYGTLNKSGGASVGARFATLPTHRGTPLMASLTLNPLVGSIAANYAVVAGRHCSLASRLDFNVFSYESGWAVGMELWRKPFAGRLPDDDDDDEAGAGERPGRAARRPRERSFEAKLAWRLDDPPEEAAGERVAAAVQDKDGQQAQQQEEYAGVLKARLDQNLRIGLLWEGRVKSLLFSLGSSIDLRKTDKPFRTLGLEVQFSS